MRALLSLFISLALVTSSHAAEFDKGQWIDLTHEFSEETIYWPTSETFSKTTVAEGQTDAGYYYSAYNFSSAEHGGTHLDAPIHFHLDRHTVDQVPIDRLIGSAVTVRVSEQAQANRNYQVSVKDLQAWEQRHGRIPDHSIVLIDTGSSKLWPNKLAYLGTEKRGEEGVKELAFPGIHPEAATFLASKRDIKAVGIDTPSIDFGGSTLFETHQILFADNIPGFENVANLAQLPAKDFTIIALPMKIKDGSGGPLRIVAFVPD